MDEVLSQLEALKDSLVAQAIATLQSDADLAVHVIAALPRVKQLIQVLKQIQAQSQPPAPAP